MEPNDKRLDQLFGRLLREDERPMSSEEQQAKNRVWKQLQPVAKRRVFPFWKVAVAVLLLLLGSSSIGLWTQLGERQMALEQLQQELKATQQNLDEVQAQLADRPGSIAPAPSSEAPQVVVEEKVKTEYVEKLVYQRDTLWLMPEQVVEQVVQVVRDTVFVEVPQAKGAQYASQEATEDSIKMDAKARKRPSKVEFVFRKKAPKKPSKVSDFIIIDSGVAKKQHKDKKGMKPIPIHN